MIIEMYSLICQNRSSNQPEPSLHVSEVLVRLHVCTCVQLCCRFCMCPPFKVSFSDTQSELDHDWDQERWEAAKVRKYLWNLFIPTKMWKEKWRLHSEAAASCLKVQRCFQVGAGQNRKTGRCCRVYVEVTEKYVTNPRHSSDTVVCFWTTGEERSSVLLRKLCRLTQHCHLLLTCRHADARFKYCKQSKSVTDFYCYKPKEKYSSSLSLHLSSHTKLQRLFTTQCVSRAQL